MDSPGLDDDRLRRVRDRLGARDWRTVTLSELAEAAGVSRMTLHRHGIGKDEVLAQLAGTLEREHREALFPALVAEGAGRERLRQALAALCVVNERYLGMIEALGEQLDRVFHDQEEGPVLTRAGFTDGLRRIVEDGVADGSLRSEDPAETATLLFNAIGWTYRHMRLGHRWPPERARAGLVALLVDGVAV
ncbi:hypothetical protein [Patulibacter defluvii]|uniref:hypothetical protein n=1 Tax=Patulibacter defluvii TaxID=3095358 RepID=UPI002A74EAA9|nr:hypothetical protein [Patulibacter sp. DM4]